MLVFDHNIRWPATIAPFLVLALASAGCGNSGQLETARVAGRVTLDGRLLEKGTVVFTPQHGRAARGTIAADGSFSLTTYKPEDGAVVGTHKVAVIAVEGIEAFEGNAPSSVPQRYAAPETSGIVAEVNSGQTNDIAIELKSK